MNTLLYFNKIGSALLQIKLWSQSSLYSTIKFVCARKDGTWLFLLCQYQLPVPFRKERTQHYMKVIRVEPEKVFCCFPDLLKSASLFISKNAKMRGLLYSNSFLLSCENLYCISSGKDLLMNATQLIITHLYTASWGEIDFLIVHCLGCFLWTWLLVSFIQKM